jgi:uroporphyrinogen-III decarboxylase
MQDLTCGERVTRTILGKKTDRVPFGVGLGWFPWGSTEERWRAESGNPRLDCAKELGFDRSWAIPDIKLGIFPPFEKTILAETDEFITMRDERGITMRQRRDMGSMPEFLDYPVKTRADWERIKERLDPADPGRVALDWPAFRARVAATGEAVQVGFFPYGVFGTPRDLMGAEELLISFYTDPDLVRDMMNRLASVWIAVYERVAAEVRIDHIHIWEDMSGRQGSLISPAMTREFMMPCYDRVADFARRAGVRVISVDTDGDCGELVPLMMEHGVNLFLPFEVQAGNDILAYRRRYPTLGIMGGLDKRALAGTREDVDREVRKAREMVKYGRYIPGFDHLIPPDVPWDNFKYAAAKLRDVCYRV